MLSAIFFIVVLLQPTIQSPQSASTKLLKIFSQTNQQKNSLNHIISSDPKENQKLFENYQLSPNGCLQKWIDCYNLMGPADPVMCSKFTNQKTCDSWMENWNTICRLRVKKCAEASEEMDLHLHKVFHGLKDGCFKIWNDCQHEKKQYIK